jgi:hypothetical protein
MFAEKPLDNRTVNKFAALPHLMAFPGHLERRHGRNDRKFRPDWLFCNIEPKICQYG